MSLFLEDFREECHVRRWVGTTNNGRSEEYGPPEAFPCRWEPAPRLAKSAEGKAVVCQGTLYTTARLKPRDLLWLPGDNPATPGLSHLPVNAYERKDLETGGFDHTEVVL